MAALTKSPRPPIAPKPTFKIKPTKEDEAETSSTCSYSNSLISSEDPVPSYNHKHLDSLTTASSELDNAREKNEGASAKQNSKPGMVTDMFHVSNIRAKVGEGNLSSRTFLSPIPKPRQKTFMNKASSQGLSTSPAITSSDEQEKHMSTKHDNEAPRYDLNIDTAVLPEAVVRVAPVPQPRNSLLVQTDNDVPESSKISSTDHEITASPVTANSVLLIDQCLSNTASGVARTLSENHYEHVWKATSKKGIENQKTEINIHDFSCNLGRTASASHSSASPKIKARRPSAPPPIPPIQGINSQSIASVCNSPLTSNESSFTSESTNVTENVYHEAEIQEHGLSCDVLTDNGLTAEDQLAVEPDNLSESDYMVPVDILADCPNQLAPGLPGATASHEFGDVRVLSRSVTLESGNSNIYEDLVSSSEDERSIAVGDQKGDVYSNFPDDTFAREGGPKGSSSDSDVEPETSVELRTLKLRKKSHDVAHEIMTSEKDYLDALVLLNIDFRQHLSKAAEDHGQPVIPSDCINKIFNQLPQLANLNEDLLKDFQHRLENWDTDPRIADVFVRKGSFLQMYTTYLRDFQNMNRELDNAIKNYPEFAEALKDFEKSERCRDLQIRHFMLKPVQRITQYRLLLTEYKKNLPNDSPDHGDVNKALEIVSKAADHANEAMKLNDSLQSLLELQSLLIGDFTVIEPSRVLVRRGDVYKQSRKELQSRHLFLFNDYLVITTPQPPGHYKIKYVLPVLNMQAKQRAQNDFQKEFEIITKKRSFLAVAFTVKECDDWVAILKETIEERERKIRTYNKGLVASTDSKQCKLGELAPVWVADKKVTMCMVCSASFSFTNRRHHCRACGSVVCGVCSVYRAPLKYAEYEAKRCCRSCYEALRSEAESLSEEIFCRFYQTSKVYTNTQPKLPGVLKEVAATDPGECNGYLSFHIKKRWERYWFVLQNKVLYRFNACEDTAAIETKVLLGYEVEEVSSSNEGFDKTVVFQLTKPGSKLVEPMVFKTDTAASAEKWMTKMRESTIA
ncbi:FYVE, RhoGEF and PH domain-containing protein 6-like [Watersipora subatra]|uniref:FYVE, RhoGEF and PH domain-containing protein 6-like n=1 Tax=Watersipora subatra TaxID=2589382 RepID=UPI00355C92FF